MISGANYREGVALSPDGAVYVTLASGSTIPSPTFTGVVKGSDTLLLTNGIPFVMAPTGTMANNGAVTLGTALGRIYTKCFMYFPAGAVAAGVPAAASWLYTEMSSTTVGVVYNNSYAPPGAPAVPTKVAFATTGPGAFAGVTSAVAGPGISVPANAMASNGSLWGEFFWAYNNTAGTKTMTHSFGGSSISAPGRTTQLTSEFTIKVVNQGQTGIQMSTSRETNSTGVAAASNALAIDTTSAQTFGVTFTRATATDYLVLEQAWAELLTNGT